MCPTPRLHQQRQQPVRSPSSCSCLCVGARGWLHRRHGRPQRGGQGPGAGAGTARGGPAPGCATRGSDVSGRHRWGAQTAFVLLRSTLAARPLTSCTLPRGEAQDPVRHSMVFAVVKAVLTSAELLRSCSLQAACCILRCRRGQLPYGGPWWRADGPRVSCWCGRRTGTAWRRRRSLSAWRPAAAACGQVGC